MPIANHTEEEEEEEEEEELISVRSA